MSNLSDEYRISHWLAEFSNPDTEQSFQKHFQNMTRKQLAVALIVWAFLLLFFALPDYQVLGLSDRFYYLMAYRMIVVAALFVIIVHIRRDKHLFKINYAVTAVVLVGFSGFMLFFFYRPDATHWIVGVIMLMIIALLMFIPIRFVQAFAAALYGVVITLVTRYAMGSPTADLIGLLCLLMLPFVIGTATARRLAFLQRKQFALASQTAKINQDLQHEIERRLKLEATLKELAATDPLTGLYNRWEYEMLFMREIERARRTNAAVSICIVDLDHFKTINDTYGHGAGDEVLRNVAKICRESLRSVDIIGRLGGEEFIILMPETPLEKAVVIGRRLLDALAGADMNAGASTIHLTATIGISQLLPEDRDYNAVIQRADAALYRGKEAGRNRVEVNLI